MNILIRFLRLFSFTILFFSMVTIAEGKCEKKMSETQLNAILKAHSEWLKDRDPRENQLRKVNLDCLDHNSKSLRDVDLSWANLIGVDLNFMDLSGTKFYGTNLSKAILVYAKLMNSNLQKANLSNASLADANLQGANLNEANLKNADLSLAKLIETKLSDTDLNGADFRHVDMEGTLYEPIGIPNKDTLGQIKNLDKVTFAEGQQKSLVELRAVLRAAGLRDLERQATYAIEKGKTEYAPGYKKYVRVILFEWTCEYGLKPLEGFFCILYIFGPCAILYFFVIFSGSPWWNRNCYIKFVHKAYKRDRNYDIKTLNRPIKACIVKSWRKENSKVTFKNRNSEIILEKNLWIAMFTAIVFSLYSAFEIGWGELTIGQWIKRLQFEEYKMDSYGWIRTVSGAQSIISTYLLAIMMLSYFGRPFG